MSNFRRRFMVSQNDNQIPSEDGVYIQSIDGNFYTYDEWNLPNEQANGVAVISSEHPNGGFVIAPAKSKRLSWINNDKYVRVTGVVTTEDTDMAKKDYKGIENSAAIALKYGNTDDYAVGWCHNYTFPNGKKGYLGSCGEWWIAYNNKNETNSCMSLIGGVAIAINGYHSASTQANYMYAWTMYWGDGFTATGDKLRTNNVRAFCSL